jgi:hypothetical protein
MTTLTLSK